MTGSAEFRPRAAPRMICFRQAVGRAGLKYASERASAILRETQRLTCSKNTRLETSVCSPQFLIKHRGVK